MNSFYEIKIEGKDVKRFIKKMYNTNIYIEDIELYDRVAYIKISKENYVKLKKCCLYREIVLKYKYIGL